MGEDAQDARTPPGVPVRMVRACKVAIRELEDKRTVIRGSAMMIPGHARAVEAADMVMEGFPATVSALGAMGERASGPEGLRVQSQLGHAAALMDFIIAFNVPGGERNRPKFLSQCQRGASGFLHCVPFEPNLIMLDPAFRWTLLRWLDMDATAEATLEGCTCASARASVADHLDNCAIGGGRQVRHNAVVRTIQDMMASAGATTQLEPRSVFPGTGQGGPDLAALGFPTTGTNALVEVSITNPNTTSEKVSAARIPLVASDTMAEFKRKKYRAAASAAGYENWQAIVETGGAFGVGLLKLIHLSSVMAVRTGRPGVPEGAPWTSASFSAYWTQRVSVAVRIGSLQMVGRAQARLPSYLGEQRERQAELARRPGIRRERGPASQATNGARSVSFSQRSAS